MYTLPHHFERLLGNIEAPEHRRRAAETIPPEVRGYLKESEAIATVAPHTRLAGSYARHTGAGDIKDIDTIVFVDPTYAEDGPSATFTALGNALGGLAEALGYPRGSIETKPQRRSYHVHLEGEDFHLDIVPAVAVEGLHEALVVPDRSLSEWVDSHPLGYAAHLSEVNGEHEGKAVKLVKIVKHWRDAHMVTRRPKSYWLECLVVRHICRGWVPTSGLSIAEVLADLFDSIYERFEGALNEDGKVPSIPDPMLGNNVAAGWERTHFETFMRRLGEARRWAREALEADDREKAIELWQKVLDPDGTGTFPTSVDEDVRAAAAAVRGSRFVTGAGLVLPSKPTSGVAVEAPRHRFYGDR